MRRVCVVLRARIAHAVRLGRPADGWVDVERLAHVARAVDDQRYMMGFLIAAAQAGTATEQIRLLAARAPPGPARAERIARILERLDRPRVRLALRGELEIFLGATRTEIAVDKLPDPKIAGVFLVPDYMRRWSRLPRPLRRLILLRDRSRTAQLYAEACHALERPFFEGYVTVQALERALGPSYVSSPAAFSPVGMSNLQSLVRTDAELRADDGGTRSNAGESWYEREGLDLAIEIEVAPR